MLFISFLIFLVTLLGFALTKNVYLIAFLFIIYGAYQGIFRTVGNAFAADFVPDSLRATSIGWFNATVGLSALVASIAAGQFYDKVSHPAVFLVASVFVALGTFFLLILNLKPASNK